MNPAETKIVFAHGAGAGPDSEFMINLSQMLEDRGFQVVRFAFPYWQKVIETGKKRPPDTAAKLDAYMRKLALEHADEPLIVMGKSMGARVAFRIADEVNALAAIGVGFPFHPPGRQEKHRLDELKNNRDANLIIQGTNDPFGKRHWVRQQQLPENLQLEWIEQANHDLTPNKSAGVSQLQAWNYVADEIISFVECL